MRKPLAIVALSVAVLSLTGCFDAFLPPAVRTTSTPTGEQVAADLQGFYGQQLVWAGCGDGFQCATAEAPLDWSDPQRATIDLALIRQAATGGTALGSLLVNPGGPGGSGYDLVEGNIDFATSEALQRQYDVVGFDPRGVGRSTAVSCFDDPADFDTFLFGIQPGVVGSAGWTRAVERTNARFGEDCAEHTGELLGHVDTVSAARDLDLLRAVLGDERLNYLGYSYGTLLGATYAQLYPEKTGRLVLDGALDPAASSFEVSLEQAKGFEGALRAYLESCTGEGSCPFRGTVDQAMTTIRTLLDRLDASPLRAPDGRELGSAAMFTAIIYPLYSKSSWSALDDVFAEVMSGSAEYAFSIVDQYYDRQEDGGYGSNATEAFLAINCLDYPLTDDPEGEADQLRAAAPVLGPQFLMGGVTCADWPYRATGVRERVSAAGSADILVIGTTNDPATPYVWAQSLAGQLENGHLVTYDGEGHTAYNKGSSCVDAVVDAYLLDGTVPSADPRC